MPGQLHHNWHRSFSLLKTGTVQQWQVSVAADLMEMVATRAPSPMRQLPAQLSTSDWLMRAGSSLPSPAHPRFVIRNYSATAWRSKFFPASRGHDRSVRLRQGTTADKYFW